MSMISPEIEQDLERRVAEGPYASVDDLLRRALHALDGTNEVMQAYLEEELRDGLEGDDVEMTEGDWDDIEREALEILDKKR